MTSKQDIPVFTVEEHHEAFIAWSYAVREGWIPDRGNCLFHVDAHSDMATPRFNRSIHDVESDISDVKNFAYKELNIATFIIPACYQGLFNRVYWVKPKSANESSTQQERFVRSYNQSGKRLISGKTQNLPKDKDIVDPDRKTFDYFWGTVEQLPSHKEVVLDIDLDYFSCAGNPNELQEIVIEITGDEYQNFIADPYHRLNYIGIHNIEAVQQGDKCYYVINKFDEKYPTKWKVGNDVVVERIDKFMDCLASKNITPLMIDICRSRFSGYTPKDQWSFIEENLLEKLDKHFKIKQIQWN